MFLFLNCQCLLKKKKKSDMFKYVWHSVFVKQVGGKSAIYLTETD